MRWFVVLFDGVADDGAGRGWGWWRGFGLWLYRLLVGEKGTKRAPGGYRSRREWQFCRRLSVWRRPYALRSCPL